MIKMQKCLHLTCKKSSSVFSLMHKTDLLCRYGIQFSILEKEGMFIADNSPAVSE